MLYQETLRMLKKAAEPNTPTTTTWDSMKKDLLKPRAIGAPALPAFIGHNRAVVNNSGTYGTSRQPQLNTLELTKRILPRPTIQPVGPNGEPMPFRGIGAMLKQRVGTTGAINPNTSNPQQRNKRIDPYIMRSLKASGAFHPYLPPLGAFISSKQN